METSGVKRLKEQETENRRFKRMFADPSLGHKILKNIKEKL